MDAITQSIILPQQMLLGKEITTCSGLVEDNLTPTSVDNLVFRS